MEHPEKSYRFAALADIHIDWENDGKNIYFIHAEKNFSRALEVLQDRGCELILCVGDQVTNATGAKEEWRRYRRLIEASGYRGQILEAMGNHETRFAQYGGCTIEECRREFIEGALLAKKPVLRPDGKTYYTYLDDVFGDAFVFLSLENGVNVNEIDNFSDEQMDWAEDTLAQLSRENRRIFLIQHAPVYGFGAGDDNKKPAYEGSIRMTDRDGSPFHNNLRFCRLLRAYKDMIWLSGHTHVDFRDNVTYSNDYGNACHMLHLPALAGSTRMLRKDDGHTLDRSFDDDAAQGMIADVYEDRVVFRGIDFTRDCFYPEYAYTIKR